LTAGAESAPRRRPRWLRRLAAVGLLCMGGCGVGVGLGMNPSTPTDWLINLPGFPHETALEAAEPGTLVVLQHGLWRSAASLGRLERALVDHGYRVLNTSYPSTEERIEDHAARLGTALRAELEREPARRLAFVGHSMGGLVIRACLGRADGFPADTVIFIGTPQRGAALAAERDGFFFRLVMGDAAALQLLPGDPFYESLGPVPARRVVVIRGGLGDGEGFHAGIPGDDDGTVGVDEADLPEADAVHTLPIGHTRLSLAEDVIRAVLTELRN
jgi:pimeloyl-ACP methyl ester carboxylesterase